VVLGALIALAGGWRAKADTNSDSVTALRQLVEQQNRKLEELNEKVRLLEEREKEREAASAEQRLPAIVIDTNGNPLAAAASTLAGMDPAASAPARPAPQISAGPDGFSFQSADTNFTLALHGVAQADSRAFFKDNPLTQGDTGFLVRRARPIIKGTLFRDFDFQIAPDFAGSSFQLFDAYVNYIYRPELQVRVGKFRGPVSLENLQDDRGASFNERSLASDLAPMRDIGIELHGDIGKGTLGWAAGVYDDDGDYRVAGNSPFDNHFEVGGRLFYQPFKNAASNPLRGLGFGLGASYSDARSNSAALPATTGGSLPGYVSTGQQQFFAYNPLYGAVVADGVHSRFSPQGYYCVGPFGAQGEFVISDQSVLNNLTSRHARLDNTAWQASAQWVMTGENASFDGLTPAHPFNPRAGQWGAWQWVARYSELNIDSRAFDSFSDPATSARSAAAWSVGLNWWLNRNVRVLTSFSHTVFQGGGGENPNIPGTLAAPATVSHQDEMVLFTRVQVAF
jgi:phosphate-selective porin OprO/OprP